MRRRHTGCGVSYRVAVTTTVVRAAVALALLAVVLPAPATAHWRNYCQDGVKIKWSNDGYGHARLKAIAVHEAGHSYGVGHWRGCDPDTMMVATWKCLWGRHRINTMKSHDERDVRNTY